MNEYANRFCTSCGEKLWRADVFDYKYDFEPHLFTKRLPHRLRNTSVFKRYKADLLFTPHPGDKYGAGLEKLRIFESKSDDALSEIGSRWKVVSPNYCISCLGIIGPDEYSCPKCGSDLGDKKRVEQLQSEKDSYAEPIFDTPELKFTFNFSEHYLSSFAPSIAESQFEYRERLKWEFAENTIRKNNIKNSIRLATKKSVSSKRKTGKGGFCGLSCRHFYEEYLDDDGSPTGTATGDSYYYCSLGYSTGGFCKHFEW